MFWKIEAIFGRFGNLWGFMENSQTSQKWLQSLKTNECENISDAAGLPQSRLCILEWSNQPQILVPGLKSEFMDTLFSTFYHFDQLLPRWRPPLSWAVHCVTVSPIDAANKIVNAIWAPEDPLNTWKVIPTHRQGAQGHFITSLFFKSCVFSHIFSSYLVHWKLKNISNIPKPTSWFRGWKLLFDMTHSHKVSRHQTKNERPNRTQLICATNFTKLMRWCGENDDEDGEVAFCLLA